MCEMLISGNFPSQVICIRERTDSWDRVKPPGPWSQQEMFSSSLTRGGFFSFTLRRFGGSDLPNVQSAVCILISLWWEGRGAKRQESLSGCNLGAQWAEASVPLLHNALGAAWVLSTALHWGSVCTPCSGIRSYSQHRWQVRSASSVPQAPGLAISPSLKI